MRKRFFKENHIFYQKTHNTLKSNNKKQKKPHTQTQNNNNITTKTNYPQTYAHKLIRIARLSGESRRRFHRFTPKRI
jgi:NAD-dependent SIR2 family protein deacetylase